MRKVLGSIPDTDPLFFFFLLFTRDGLFLRDRVSVLHRIEIRIIHFIKLSVESCIW